MVPIQNCPGRQELNVPQVVLAAHVCVRDKGEYLRMGRAEDYRRYAAECLRIAQTISNPGEKNVLLQMAETWRRLAIQIESRAVSDEHHDGR